MLHGTAMTFRVTPCHRCRGHRFKSTATRYHRGSQGVKVYHREYRRRGSQS